MRTFMKALLASSTLVLVCPARATETPAASADAIGGFYGKILGVLPAPISKSIVVTRDGNVTKVTFDIVQLSQPLRAAGVTLLAKPLTLVYTPTADGTIRQSMTAPLDLTVAIDASGKLGQTGSFLYKGLTFEGVFDPGIAFYRSMRLSVANVAGDVSERENGTSASVVAGVNGADMTATPAADGTVDIKQKQVMSGFVEHIRIDPSKASSPHPGPAMDVELSIPEIQADIFVNGWKAIAARDMALFVLDNHTDAQISAKQGEFKQHIRDLVPLFNSASIAAEAQHMLVQTPYGRGEIGSVGANFAIDTKSPSSTVTFGEHLKGVAIDTVFMPVWAKPLVPSDIEFQFDIKGFDLGGLMTAFVGAMDKYDFTNPKPLDMETIAKQAFMPTGGAHINLLPSSIVAPSYKIDWHGGIDTRGEKAKAHVDVSATGLDETIKILSQVRDKGAPEAVIGLYAAKALALPGPNGSVVWAIDVSEEGAMLVNGKPVGPKR